MIFRKAWIALLLLLSVTSVTVAQQTPKPFTVLFLGDSLTAGYGLEEGQAFPDLIAARFKAEGRKDIKIINGGISGSTSASALGRLQWYVRSKPDLMILSLGANDGLRGLPVAEMRNNLVQTIEFAQKNGVKVALTGMMIPPNYGPEYTASFAKVFPELAAAYHLPFLPFLLEGVAAKPELNQGDGIHPNVEGAKIVAKLVYDFLVPLVPAK
ncbi:MAG TPA: arylesterase [Candidatus Acidoferrum sp.]|nr:arylesterase [Candidatus Acidoferrum sp.]